MLNSDNIERIYDIKGSFYDRFSKAGDILKD